MSDSFQIRRATGDDIEIIARQRAKMFVEMGRLQNEPFEPLVEATMRYLEIAMPEEEYVGWLAFPDESAGTIVAGAGLQQRRVLPHPLASSGGALLAAGRQGIILNVYTEPDWRRRGLAEALVRRVLEWAASAGLETIVLHASEAGRPLYERMGFVQTNEMRFAGPVR